MKKSSKKKKKQVKRKASKKTASPRKRVASIKSDEDLEEVLHEKELIYLKKHIHKLWDQVTEANDRLQDLEIQTNLMTRLITTICMDYLKLKPEKFNKLVRRVEKEAIEDSQIMHLEHLFSLEHNESKRRNKKKKS